MSSAAEALAPTRCTATAKRTGEQCQAWAIRGAKVCRVHGGMARQVRAKAAERLLLAERMAAAPRRHPAEVLLDALAAADLLMRDALEAGAPMSAEELPRVVDAIERAQRFARSTLDLKLAERQQTMFEEIAGSYVRLIERVLEAAELSPSQQAAAHLTLVNGLQELAGGPS